jgi:hypothetical protein
MVHVAATAGYLLSELDARLIWRQYSATLFAGWLALPRSDSQLLEILLEHGEVSSEPAPPDSYASWLDYAVETFDTRSLAVERMFDDDLGPSRDEMRSAARAELERLR